MRLKIKWGLEESGSSLKFLCGERDMTKNLQEDCWVNAEVLAEGENKECSWY